VSCLVFNLSEWSDAKTFNCLYKINWFGSYCSFGSTALFSDEEASFGVSNLRPGETPADITSVHFYSSSIYYVPASIFTSFSKLKELLIDDSNVQEIRSNTFENATKLQEIDLTGNKISALKADTFRGAISLETIILHGNQISHIDPNAFRGLPNLHVLSLRYNKITELDGRILTPLALNVLDYLGFDGNSIRGLDKNTFRNLPHLRGLGLSNNLLETLDETLFLNNTELVNLDINTNKIDKLNSTMFQHLTKLEWLDLRANICVNDWVRSFYSKDEPPNPAADVVYLAQCNNNLKYKKIGSLCHKLISYFQGWVYEWGWLRKN
jgi:Leucine-rich repeat (LRR) protein